MRFTMTYMRLCKKSLELDYSNQPLADQEEARKKKRKKHAAPRTPSGSPPSPPPPLPSPIGPSGAPGISGASGSSHLPPHPPPLSTGTSGSAQQQGSKAPSLSKPTASTHQSMAWTTSNTRFESTGFTEAQELSPIDSLIQDDSIPNEQVYLSDDEDSENDHLPKADSRQDWWKPIPEEERPATLEPAWTIPSFNTGDMATFIKWYCRQVNKTKLTQADFKGQAYEVVKAFYPNVIHLQFQMEECHKMLTAQVDWTNPEGDQFKIDVNQPLPHDGPPGYVIVQPQFFFNKDLEYLRYGSKGSNPALSISKMKAASYPDFGLKLLVLEQMWIDDVCTYDISAKYGIYHWWFNRQKFYIDRHDSLSRRKDVRTHMRILSVVKIKAYSRYGDFEDLNLLLPQGHLDHLLGSDKRMLSAAVKLWTRNLVIRQRVEDFQLSIESYQKQLNLTKPRWDAKGYEFKHDYTIIESPRTWPRKNNEFIAAIERRLKTRRIYRNLECFVGGRVHDIDYRLL
ncbi:hypothetical protein Tco_0791890 [Tanacetum coccineum]